MINKVIKVDGMSCDHCKNTIESALAKINGVRTAEVDLDKNEVRVDYNDELVSTKDLHDTIEDQGYDVKNNKKLEVILQLFYFNLPLV